MPWNRNQPDPLAERRRQLAAQERVLAQQRARLTRELDGENSPGEAKPAEPPVWRMEEDPFHRPAPDSMPARKRHLARQRQRDMVLFFIFITVLFAVIGILLWVAYVHNVAPVTGA